MTLSVHLTNTPDDKTLAYLHSQLHESITVTCGDVPETADFHILVTGRPTHEMLKASNQLQALVIPFAGVPDVTIEMMREYPQVTSP